MVHAVGDNQLEHPFDALQAARARAGDDGDQQFLLAVVDDSAVHEGEGSAAPGDGGRNPLKGQDGAYGALERVSATLAGRSGTFALVHRGIVDHGQQELLITVVPGSGTGGLEGIEGVFKLVITDGVHHYDLAYSLPAAH